MQHLGVICHQTGRFKAAAELMRKVITLRPSHAESYFNLGVAQQADGAFDEAIDSYRNAISLRPNYAEAHNNLGDALMSRGKLEEAISAFQAAVVLRPSYADACSNLGAALKHKGELEEAIAAYRQAIALRADFSEAHYNLGNALQDSGQLDEAIASYRRAIALRGDIPEAHNNLGNALKCNGQFDEAINACRAAISLRPNYAQAHSNLGAILQERGRLDEAVAACQAAIALHPTLPEARNNLGTALKDKGQLDAAIASYRQAIALQPGLAQAASNLVYILNFHPAYDACAIAEELRRWNQEYAEPLQSSIQAHPNGRDVHRPLRIGYLSPDFRDHVIGRNIMPLFSHCDHERSQVTCYSRVVSPDALTAQFKRHSDGWRNIVGVPDERVAAQIRDDRIDILVDLTMHLAGNRLLIFARKPAPLQVTFAGYPGSTGLRAIDYRLSDPYLDPPGADDSIYSEKTVRLPDSFWCYDPLDDNDLAVSALPALKNGFVTFGCLNNFCKINDRVLHLWAHVLRRAEDAHLLLLARAGSHQQHTLDVLRHDGIDLRRVEFVPPHPRRAYLELYHRIDVGLDTFPYNGHTTSLDSCWMGVPVVTLVGQTVVSRAGWSQLSNLGLTELAGNADEQFVQVAVELANDLTRLGRLRSTLRKRMEQSPLMDATKFAQSIEASYRQMWQSWCESVS